MKITDSGTNPYLADGIIREITATEIVVGLTDERIIMRLHVEHRNADGTPCTYVGDQRHEPVASNQRRVVLTDAETFSYRTATEADDPADVVGEYDLIMASPAGQHLRAMVALQLDTVLANGLIDSGAVRVR